MPPFKVDLDVPLLTDIDVSPQKVEVKLASLKPHSSPGPDAIHPRVLRESSRALAVPLSKIFRKSLDSGRLPIDWKTGEVIPIFKKGDRQKPSSKPHRHPSQGSGISCPRRSTAALISIRSSPQGSAWLSPQEVLLDPAYGSSRRLERCHGERRSCRRCLPRFCKSI